MNDDRLISRYLDGDLSPAEAEELLDRVAADPELERELRSLEEALAACRNESSPSDGFTGRVMAEVRGEAVASRGGRSRTWRRLAIAASIAAALGIGWLAGSSGPATEPPDAGRQPLAARLSGPGVIPAANAEDGINLVRLVYLPRDPGVENVAVAGSFNGWDPARSPMRREDGVWVAVIPLPSDVHEYMFVVDGTEWVADPLAAHSRDDGFGNRNSVIDLTL